MRVGKAGGKRGNHEAGAAEPRIQCSRGHEHDGERRGEKQRNANVDDMVPFEIVGRRLELTP